jgi:outer membrane protein assembly factor BamD
MILRRAITYTVMTNVLFLASLACSHAQVTSPDTNVGVNQPDKVLFDLAMTSIKRSKYAEARTLLETVISTFPDSDYVPRAKLSMGDAWYAEGDLKQAEMEYQDFVTFFPNRPEVAATKLKIESIHKRAKT